MKQKTIQMATILFIFLGAGFALAFQGGCPREKAGAGSAPGCCAVEMIPGLTDAQKAEITTLKTDFNNDAAPLRKEIHEKQMDLKTLMQAEALDKEAIFAKQEEVALIKGKLQKMALTYKMGLSDLLTPEQKKTAGPGLCPMGYEKFGPCGGEKEGFHGKKGKAHRGKANCPAFQNES